MNIKRSDIAAITGLIVALVMMALPLQTEAKSLAAGTSVIPTVWRFVDFLRERFSLSSDNTWYLANALSVAVPMAAYTYLTLSGQEVFTLEGLGQAFLVGAGIAMGADKLHRKAENDAKTEDITP